VFGSTANIWFCSLFRNSEGPFWSEFRTLKNRRLLAAKRSLAIETFPCIEKLDYQIVRMVEHRYAAFMKRDLLIILAPNFRDHAYPGRRFYCWHCALLEGILASFPALNQTIEVERIAWPKPRQRMVDLIGEENQSVPVLILADDRGIEVLPGQHEGRKFISDKDDILTTLSSRHGIPEPHP